MNAVTEQALADRGLYNKFEVRRTDGSSDVGGRHHGDDFFVLNLTTDPAARAAAKEYATQVAATKPALASDLRTILRACLPSPFVTVPEITVPDIKLADGTIIPGWTEPSFQIGRYFSTVDENGLATVQADGVPTVEISYYDAMKANQAASLKPFTERQNVALSWLLTQVGANWTGGEVGNGDLRQGLRKGSVDGPQANDFEPADPDEDRRFYLPNGEIIYDMCGHLCGLVFDNVQGDENGLIAKPFVKESISLAVSPFPSMKRGTGWQPSLPCNWSGCALFRGGGWGDGVSAGVFSLGGCHPSYGSDYIGFRSTK